MRSIAPFTALVATLALGTSVLPAEANSGPAKSQMKRVHKEWAAARAGMPGYEMPGFMDRLFGIERGNPVVEGAGATRDAAKEAAPVPPAAPDAPER